jgi:hypothetical protein
MSVKEKTRHILLELKGHAPFTLLGAVAGIAFMLLLRNLSQAGIHKLFTFFHPVHVILSAIVTASMFKLHAARKRFILVLLVGYFGSIGIATLSDIIIPHIGATVLDIDVPTHDQTYHAIQDREHEHEAQKRHRCRIHLGFIEEWYIVNPAALLGVFIAYFLPRTKFPHAGHILISTWASSSYLLMNIQPQLSLIIITGIFVTLFLATWLPCCISDIVFPLLFVKSDVEIPGPCPIHTRHSHPHVHKEQNRKNETDRQRKG